MKKIFKTIYSNIPFKLYFFDVLKSIYIPRKNITKHLHFKGDFPVRMTNNLSFIMNSQGFQIENELYWYGLYGGWEKTSQKIWCELARNANIIVDVGANNGLYSLAARKINNQAKIYAAEPLSFVLKNLYYNIKINNINDINVVEFAFSNTKSSNAIMYLPKGAEYVRSAAVNTNLLDRDKSDIDEVIIPTLRLDEWIEQEKIKKIDLIKIDVESHEPAVLDGMGKYLEEFMPDLIIEVSYPGVAEKLNSILHKLNYLYFNIDEEKGLRQESLLTQSDSDNYLICKPETAQKLGLIK